MSLEDPTADEISELIEDGLLLNEQGVPLLTRWMAKITAANPQEMQKFLEREGFTVTPVQATALDRLVLLFKAYSYTNGYFWGRTKQADLSSAAAQRIR